MLEFNDILRHLDIQPSQVLVVRHRPDQRELREALPVFAAEDPECFNAYQRTHGPRVESALSRAQWLASFIGHEPGRALFVGMYRVRGASPIDRDSYWSLPYSERLRLLGDRGPQREDGILLFDLAPSDHAAGMKGRLVVGWPSPERAWFRWADRNHFVMIAMSEESVLVKPMPDWHSLVLGWAQLGVLPASWQAKLAQWRGIYLIRDLESGKAYVGSASGQDNILGRWLGYAATGHGGNKLLKALSPDRFVFSILQRLSPDAFPAEVVQIENTWKDRLGTRAPHGLNEN